MSPLTRGVEELGKIPYHTIGDNRRYFEARRDDAMDEQDSGSDLVALADAIKRPGLLRCAPGIEG